MGIERIKIGKRIISEASGCYIIAEAGSNHNRDLGIAKRLIEAAAEAGADAVKFQLFKADKISADTKHDAARVSREKRFGSAKTLHELYSGLELPREWMPELKRHALKMGIELLATPFDYDAVDILEEIDTPAHKIASFEIVDLDLIRYAAGKGRPMIISTGTAGLSEIQDALDAIYEAGNIQVILLHCISDYPAKPGEVNLRAMKSLRDAFGVPVGYSDHTLGIEMPIAAAALGAAVIEKHFTLDKSMDGPDHGFALNPAELMELVRSVRNVEAAMGDGVKRMTEGERPLARRARRSLFAAVDMAEGEVVTEEKIKSVRPGVGIMPKYKPLILGKSLVRSVGRDEPLEWSHFIR